MVVRAGQLRTRATFQKAVTKTDEHGAPYLDFEDDDATQRVLWAQDKPLQGYMELRYTEDITSDMRVVVGDRVLKITGIYDPTGRRAKVHVAYEDVGWGDA